MQTFNHIGISIQSLLDNLEIPYNEGLLTSALENHPNYPNPPSIIDCLSELKIKAEAVQGEVYQIADVTLPGLAVKSNHKNELYYQVVVRADKERITILDHNGRESSLSHSDFTKDWDGVFIIMSRDVDSGRREQSNGILNNRFVSIVTSLALIFLMAFGGYSIHSTVIPMNLWFLYFILKLIGLFTAIELIKMDVFKLKNSLSTNLCQVGKTNDCQAVLGSNSSKVLGIISLSELGLVYFSGSAVLLLVTLFVRNDTVTIVVFQLLSILSVLALPFTIYAIFQQLFVIKKFCTLCLIIQGLLWLEVILVIVHIEVLQPVLLSIRWFEIGTIFLLPGLVWMFLKKPLSNSRNYTALENSFKWFRLDLNVFKAKLMTRENRVQMPDDLGFIKLGKPNAKIKIHLISEATCNACANAFIELEYLLRQYPEDIELNILSTCTMSDIEISTKWLALSITDPESTQAMMHEWYSSMAEKGLGNKDISSIKYMYLSWIAKNESHVANENSLKNLINKNENWFAQGRVKFYPTVILNGYSLPFLSYSANDLKFFMEELISE